MPTSGSVVLRVPIVVPTGRFSLTLLGLRLMSVGALLVLTTFRMKACVASGRMPLAAVIFNG